MININSKKAVITLLGSLGLISVVQAKSNENPIYHITGTTLATILTTPDEFGKKGQKTIGLLKIIPSETFLESKKDYIKKAKTNSEIDYSSGIIPFSQSPGAKDLEMNNVPVLDQGAYGTCVTFSTTVAMDALIGKGDFISQQCSLELNRTLGQNYWNGAYFASQIIDPLKKYGLVKQGKGTINSGECNEIYPNLFGMITIPAYKKRAKFAGANASNINYKYYSTLTLDNIRNAINVNHRLIMGFGLVTGQDPISIQGFDVTINEHKTSGGLWACKQPSSQTIYCGKPNAGHEIVVIGYDDKQQLLKIRNSWSAHVGDEGDFYMTYTFFEAMVFDGTEIF